MIWVTQGYCIYYQKIKWVTPAAAQPGTDTGVSSLGTTEGDLAEPHSQTLKDFPVNSSRKLASTKKCCPQSRRRELEPFAFIMCPKFRLLAPWWPNSLEFTLKLHYVCPILSNYDINLREKWSVRMWGASQKSVLIVANARYLSIWGITKLQGGLWKGISTQYVQGCVQEGASVSTKQCNFISGVGPERNQNKVRLWYRVHSSLICKLSFSFTRVKKQLLRISP